MNILNNDLLFKLLLALSRVKKIILRRVPTNLSIFNKGLSAVFPVKTKTIVTAKGFWSRDR